MTHPCMPRPPTDCGAPGSWAGISLNFTVTSNGTQFDRLGVYFDPIDLGMLTELLIGRAGIFTFQNVESEW